MGLKNSNLRNSTFEITYYNYKNSALLYVYRDGNLFAKFEFLNKIAGYKIINIEKAIFAIHLYNYYTSIFQITDTNLEILKTESSYKANDIYYDHYNGDEYECTYEEKSLSIKKYINLFQRLQFNLENVIKIYGIKKGYLLAKTYNDTFVIRNLNNNDLKYLLNDNFISYKHNNYTVLKYNLNDDQFEVMNDKIFILCKYTLRIYSLSSLTLIDVIHNVYNIKLDEIGGLVITNDSCVDYHLNTKNLIMSPIVTKQKELYVDHFFIPLTDAKKLKIKNLVHNIFINDLSNIIIDYLFEK